jgi:hypothetical protein
MLVRSLAAVTLALALAQGVVAFGDTGKQAPALVGATAVLQLTAPTGFVDDVVASDDTRLAYVVADASAVAQLHVVTVATKADVAVDIAPVTLHPIAITLLGPRAFVVGTGDDGRQVAALVELEAKGTKPAGSVVYKLGPANDITVVTREGHQRVVVHHASETKTGTRHEVEVDAIDTGKHIASGHEIELDATGKDSVHDFRVNHWADGFSRAIGIKGGEWTKQTDTKGPDTEGTFDLVSGKFVDKTPITDLFEQRRRFQALADSNGKLDFVRMAWDNSGAQAWHNGKPHPITLDQPMTNYDPKSLQGVVGSDGSVWIALKVDPVNADAVARQKADPEYFDLFHAGPDGAATRKIRIPALGLRHRFGVAGDKVWVLERNNGFERGGRMLTLYKPE